MKGKARKKKVSFERKRKKEKEDIYKIFFVIEYDVKITLGFCQIYIIERVKRVRL